VDRGVLVVRALKAALVFKVDRVVLEEQELPEELVVVRLLPIR
jgi:hypothetical protein